MNKKAICQKCFLLVLFSILGLNNTISQNIIKGIVLETERNLPLVGASVYWENTKIGTVSDSKGNFALKEDGTKSSLIISYIGFEKQVVNYEVLTQKNDLKITLFKTTYQADEVIVNATRANNKSAMAFTNLGKSDIGTQNFGQDMPQLLNFTPSLVTTSDAGAGIGYTGLRIRGTDATRINVTVNGIPINDAESQGVYWVNMPDLASSVSSVQIQRGVGTSINGAGAFGGSINIQSNEFEKNQYAELNTSVGSFNSLKNTLKFGSGLLSNRFTLDGRLSRIVSDGFVDRGASNLRSYYVSGGYFGKKSFIRLITFGGKEKTYQSWNGIAEDKLVNDRTYNAFTYENQTDNYTQTHYQALSTFNLSNNIAVNANLHYTKGKGYYEEFKEDQNLSDYGYNASNTANKTELIRQKWLDNDFYGVTYSIDYQSYKKLSASLGGGYNIYDGDHFGNIIYAKEYPNAAGFRWYFSNSTKSDFNIYGKSNLQLTGKVNIYADLQLRKINLDMSGSASKLQKIDQNHSYLFFNPKIGITASLSDKIETYLSYSIGQKEPNRTDFIDNTTDSLRKAEKLIDLEFGVKYNYNKLALSANSYFMNYKNQLVITGAINDVGEAIRTNVPKSYRAGVELEAAYVFSKKIRLNLNTTISKNKIEKFTELIPDYEGNYKVNKFTKSDIAMSPNLIIGSQMVYKPINKLEFCVSSKHVGKQYLDNTSSENKKLNAYFTNDFRANYTFKIKNITVVNLGATVYNFLNEQYESNGYTFSYLYDSKVYYENYYYPQAGRNFMLSANLKF
jgi:iron complex outermembrane recepter protein